MERSAARRADRRAAGAAAQGPGDAEEALDSGYPIGARLPQHCGRRTCCCLISIKTFVGIIATMGAEEDVRLAIFADIHANRQAFSACLEAARTRAAERFVCLGDVVGYGADPEWAVETVMSLVESGAIAVRGNHDN